MPPPDDGAPRTEDPRGDHIAGRRSAESTPEQLELDDLIAELVARTSDPRPPCPTCQRALPGIPTTIGVVAITPRDGRRWTYARDRGRWLELEEAA